MQTIILANNIVTMDPDVPSASAIAISDDGRITAVGT
jgi:predicted amidohydrolase YtcJ